jgi:hypothetical protein
MMNRSWRRHREMPDLSLWIRRWEITGRQTATRANARETRLVLLETQIANLRCSSEKTKGSSEATIAVIRDAGKQSMEKSIKLDICPLSLLSEPLLWGFPCLRENHFGTPRGNQAAFPPKDCCFLSPPFLRRYINTALRRGLAAQFPEMDSLREAIYLGFGLPQHSSHSLPLPLSWQQASHLSALLQQARHSLLFL